MRSLGNPGHVDTDVRTLRRLLQLILAGSKAKAEALVLGILQKQERHEAEQRRQIAELIRADGQRKAASVAAVAEAAAAEHEGWGKGKAKRTARRSRR